MLEYVFFNEQLRDDFIRTLTAMGLSYETSQRRDELLVSIGEDLDDDQEDRLESHYDDLMREQARYADAEDDASDAVHAVGVQYSDQQGQVCMVRLTPEVANRLHQCMSIEQLQALVQDIADQVQNGNNRPLCQNTDSSD